MIDYRKDGHIAYITISRPEALNALNSQTLDEIQRAAQTLADESDIRCAVITGAGKAFVAGADIAQMKDLTVEEANAFAMRGHAAFTALEKLPMPLIAAINGYALGGGCELALCADIRIASEKAKFGQPEVGLGITPGFGGTQRLVRTVGTAAAMELILTGRTISADEALRIGLVNRVVAPEALSDEAAALAKTIAANAPIAVRAAKAAMRRRFNRMLADDLSAEAGLFAACFETEDQRMAMAAFVNKTPKDGFTGR